MTKRRSKAGSVISAKVHTVPVPAIPTESTQFVDSKVYHKFGNDNLFPQAIASLTRKSPVHRGILLYKSIFTIGRGFTFENANPKLEEFLENANNRGESLRNIMKRVNADLDQFGNGWLEVVKGNGFLSLFHIDSTKVRLHKDNDKVIIHPDWRNETNFMKQDLKVLPLYPNFENIDGAQRAVFHFKQYEPEFSIYGIPSWISGLDASAIAYKTNRWNVSRLDNSFQPSGVLLVDGNMSPEDAKMLQDDFEEQFTGEQKQGKVLMIIKQLGKSEGTQFIPLNNKVEGDWLQLHKQSVDDLVTAHTWYRSLSGLVDNTGFDTTRILNEYQVAISTIIHERQMFLIENLTRIIEMDGGMNADGLEIINKPPVNFASLINVNRIVTIGEARRSLGLEVEDETLNFKFIENDTTGATF